MVCFLDIRSEPSGADVYISLKKVGTTPIDDYKLTEGTYNIEFRKTGYISKTFLNYKIEKKDLAKTLSVTLEAEKPVAPPAPPKKTAISINSTPAGAKIFIDGKDTGRTTHSEIEKAAGTYKIKLTLPGYKDYEKSEKLTEGVILLRNYTLEKVAVDWIGDFLKNLAVSGLSALNYFINLDNAVKNTILTGVLQVAGGEAKLESFAEYSGNKFIDEYPEYRILRGAPKGSVSVLAIIGIVGAIIGFGTLVNWLRKELPEPSGMAVWAAIEAQDWETAQKANEQYKYFITKANSWYAQILGFLNPLIWVFMRKNRDSQLVGYETYKAIIDANLGKLILPDKVKVYVRDIVDGDTIETDLKAVDAVSGNEIKLPELGKTGHASIRVVGINAPEKSPKGEILCTDIEIFKVEKSWTDEARNVLLYLNDRQVTLYLDPAKTTDTYGRILAKVEYGGKDIGLEQIKKGLACWYFREKHKYIDDELYKAETLKAMNARVGMWSDLPIQPEVPVEEVPGVPPVAPPVVPEIPVAPPVEVKKILFTISSIPDRARVYFDELYTKHTTPTDEIEQKKEIALWTEGKHKLRVTKAGYAAEADIELVAGERLTLTLELAGMATPTPELPTPTPKPEAKLITAAELYKMLGTYVVGRLRLTRKEWNEIRTNYKWTEDKALLIANEVEKYTEGRAVMTGAEWEELGILIS